MRCLTEAQIDEWLLERSIPKDPLRGDTRPNYGIEFHPPSTHPAVDAFIRHYYEWVVPGAESLIHMTDWSLYKPSEMIAITGIRESRGDDRRLIDAPGHVLNPDEVELGVSLFSLSASFEWSSYLYTPSSRSTLYNWEGETLDFWTDSEEVLAEMERIIKLFELDEIIREAQ